MIFLITFGITVLMIGGLIAWCGAFIWVINAGIEHDWHPVLLFCSLVALIAVVPAIVVTVAGPVRHSHTIVVQTEDLKQ